MWNISIKQQGIGFQLEADVGEIMIKEIAVVN